MTHPLRKWQALAIPQFVNGAFRGLKDQLAYVTPGEKRRERILDELPAENANGLNASRRLSGKKSPISRLESELRFLPLLVKTKVNPILVKSIGQICHLL